MLKVLRQAMYKAFETTVTRRWPGFVAKKKFARLPDYPGEFHLHWQVTDALGLLLSIQPNHKSNYSSFSVDLAWSRTGDFDFTDYATRLSGPGALNSAYLQRGLAWDKATVGLDGLWYTKRQTQHNWPSPFKTFDQSYNFPMFPLRSPLFTFDPKTQGPEDYQRLAAAEKALTAEQALALATPVLDDVFDQFELHVWPFIAESLIGPACAARQGERP